MKKSTTLVLRVSSVFAFLTALPYLWKESISFNIGTFTTEYYKYIANIFIVSLFALYFKNETDIIKSEFEKNKNIHLSLHAMEQIVNCFLNLDEEKIKKIKEEWNKISAFDHIIKLDNFNMVNLFIININEDNFREKTASATFPLMINSIKTWTSCLK